MFKQKTKSAVAVVTLRLCRPSLLPVFALDRQSPWRLDKAVYHSQRFGSAGRSRAHLSVYFGLSDSRPCPSKSSLCYLTDVRPEKTTGFQHLRRHTLELGPMSQALTRPQRYYTSVLMCLAYYRSAVHRHHCVSLPIVLSGYQYSVPRRCGPMVCAAHSGASPLPQI